MSTQVTCQTLRLALGVSLTFAAGQMAGWRMAFLAPILLALLLKSRQPLTLKSGAALVAVIAGTFILALAVSLPLLQYPIAATLALLLVLYWTFYLGASGAPPFAVMMMLIALILIPLLGQQSVDLSLEIAAGLVQAGLTAVLFSWLAFALLPAVPDSAPSPAGAVQGTEADPRGSARLAGVSTAVVAPLFIAFMAMGLSNYVLVLVFACLLAMQADLSAGMKGGVGLIVGNAIGGIIAIVVYELTVIVPNLFFLSLLIALVCLVLGRRIHAGGAASALCSTALTTVLLIIGMTVSPIGPDADTKFYSRIIQVAAATLYVTASFVVLETLAQRGRWIHRLE